MSFIDKLFNTDKKILAEIEKAVRPVETLADEMASLSDDELKHKTVEFKQRIAEG